MLPLPSIDDQERVRTTSVNYYPVKVVGTMSSSADKIKHLEMVQLVVSRMAQNSFLITGWAVTLTGALFTLAAKDSNPHFVLVSMVITAFFWYLDSFYLHQERLFRQLHIAIAQDIRSNTSTVPLFDMATDKYVINVGSVRKVMLSKVQRLIYGCLFLAQGIAATIILRSHIAWLAGRISSCLS